jgi:hypothetical protein
MATMRGRRSRGHMGELRKGCIVVLDNARNVKRAQDLIEQAKGLAKKAANLGSR